MNQDSLYLGVDVGTASVRAAVFDVAGRRLGMGTSPIQIFRPAEDFVEQSSDDIWRACGVAIGQALSAASVTGAKAGRIAGIGFDATCSLVALDGDDKPLTVSPTGRDEQNVIVWMDHRALAETAAINLTGHEVLKYVGGVMSPEMQLPKLKWLKAHCPRTWSRAARFLDLPDFLTYRATGIDTRSLCTTVCKWTYLGHEGVGGRWDETFFEQVGLGDLAEGQFARIGRTVRPMGEKIGGLCAAAAAELGLPAGVPVGVAIIDAHAGGLGLLGMPLDGITPDAAALDKRLALIGGTSSCHMAVSSQARFIPGVWGPYRSAMVPGMWLTEGGQSATGALIDHTIYSHARGAELAAEARGRETTIYALLNARLEELAMRQKLDSLSELTAELHVLPDHHGNRSPRADPTLRGMVCGLKLSGTLDSLALLYLATVQAVALGTRHIIEAMNGGGYAIDTILACGGDMKNPIFVREHAQATGCRVVLAREPEAVLLGSGMLGAVAGGAYPSLLAAMSAMNQPQTLIQPDAGRAAKYYDAKYAVFQRMHDDQLAYRKLMQGAECAISQ